MNIIRSDSEVVLHDAYVALEETVDQYVDSAEFLDQYPVAGYFNTLSGERIELLSALADVIRSRGGLPPAADEDKESIRLALQHLFANIADNSMDQVVEHCLHKENEITAALKALLTLDGSAHEKAIFNKIYRSHRFTRLYLRHLRRGVES